MRSLVELTEIRASADPQRVGFSFLADDGRVEQLTNGAFRDRVHAVAAELGRRADIGERVLLTYPPGLEFIVAFFAALHAGLLPVPITYPKRRRGNPRHAAIAKDCSASLALTVTRSLELFGETEAGDLTWLATDELGEHPPAGWQSYQPAATDLALLQYTSGSTSQPKGVMLSHANLIENLEVIREGFQLDRIPQRQRTVVSWLPAYHDMGLIGSILGAFFNDGQAILMSPAGFLQRPLRWLQAISEQRAAVSGAPSFAFDLCAQALETSSPPALDLSCWRLAFCGAEPISVEALERFAALAAPYGFDSQAFYPCYGLAESSLLVSGARGSSGLTTRTVSRTQLARGRVHAPAQRADSLRAAGCGMAHRGHRLRIVDPETRQQCSPDGVGEIWVSGGSVARGYWSQPRVTEEIFAAQLEPSDGHDYLRTGDLGFLHGGELYVTGRRKDLIIVRGQNHYPQDIERTATSADDLLRASCGAAFAIEVSGHERLVVAHEVPRDHDSRDLNRLLRRIRVAIAAEHELDAEALVIVPRGSLPRTTSGKIQRFACRERFQQQELKALASWRRPAANSTAVFSQFVVDLPGGRECPFEELRDQIERGLLGWLREESGDLAETELGRDQPFAEMGIDSLQAVELSRELEQWLGIELTPVLTWLYPTPAAMADYLAKRAAGLDENDPPANDTSDFEKLLDEIEGLPESEVEAMLRSETISQQITHEDDQAQANTRR